jgi:hypothetical protein
MKMGTAIELIVDVGLFYRIKHMSWRRQLLLRYKTKRIFFVRKPEGKRHLHTYPLNIILKYPLQKFGFGLHTSLISFQTGTCEHLH